VVNDQFARSANVNVELDAIRPDPDRGAKGSQGVLGREAGGTPMSNDPDKSPYM
jgi:hypothetical protein